MQDTEPDRWVSDPRAAARDARRIATRLRRRDRTVVGRWLTARAALDAAEADHAAARTAGEELIAVAMHPYAPRTYQRAALTRPADWWRLNGAGDPHTFATTRRKVDIARRQAARSERRATRAVEQARRRYDAATVSLLAALPAAAGALGLSHPSPSGDGTTTSHPPTGIGAEAS